MNKRQICIVVFALLGLSSTSAIIGAQATQTPEPARVAIINLATIYEGLDEEQVWRAEHQMRMDDNKTEEEAHQAKINTLDAILNDLIARLSQASSDPLIQRPTDTEIEAAQTNLMQATAEYQVWKELASRRMNRLSRLHGIEIYIKATEQAESLAEQYGYDIVYAIYKPEIATSAYMNSLPDQTLNSFLRTERLLWHKNTTDITDVVLGSLNNEYGNRDQ